MDILVNFPLNMAAWTYGGIILLLYALRNFQLQKKSINKLHDGFAKFMFAIGISLTLYAAVPLFTRDADILIFTMSLADSLIMLSMILQAKILEILGLISRKFFGLAAAGITTVAAYSFYLGVNHTQIQLEPYVLSHIMHPMGGWLQSLIFIFALMPAGLFFIKDGLKQKDALALFKVSGFGLAYVLTCIISVINYGVLRGQDSLFSAVSVFVSFSILLLIVLLPNKSSSTVFQRISGKINT